MKIKIKRECVIGECKNCDAELIHTVLSLNMKNMLCDHTRGRQLITEEI